jgi:hypothetical protein
VGIVPARRSHDDPRNIALDGVSLLLLLGALRPETARPVSAESGNEPGDTADFTKRIKRFRVDEPGELIGTVNKGTEVDVIVSGEVNLAALLRI